jgi:putative phosphoribosyl transferase
VARGLNKAGLATLLFDLLLPEEAEDRRNVFDIPLLATRLEEALVWLRGEGTLASLPIGLAVVSRGGRPDLAAGALARVRAPTLLIVGGYDDVVIELNAGAHDMLTCEKRLEIVPGATHLFEEPGTLDAVIELAAAWFVRFLGKGSKT